MKNISQFRLVAFGISILTYISLSYAQPGTGIKLGEGTVLIPSADLSYNYDDNIALRANAIAGEEELSPSDNESDEYFRYSFGLDLNRTVGNRKLRANAFYGEDRFDKYTDLDANNYGANFGYQWAKPTGATVISVDGGYQYAVDRGNNSVTGFVDQANNDNLTSLSERAERDIYLGRAEINQQLMNKLYGGFIFGYTDVNYKSENYNDITSWDYIVELNQEVSEKLSPYVQAGIGIDDNEGYANDSEMPFALVGARYSPTPKLRSNLSVGYEGYDRTPLVSTRDAEGNIVQTPGENESDSGFKYVARVAYFATNKSTLTLSAANRYEAGGQGTNTARYVNSVYLGFRHNTTPKLSQTLSASWREDDYLDNVLVDGEDIDRNTETLRFYYNISYQTQKPWLTLFANASYEDGTSDLPNQSYNQTVLTAGARLRY